MTIFDQTLDIIAQAESAFFETGAGMRAGVAVQTPGLPSRLPRTKLVPQPCELTPRVAPVALGIGVEWRRDIEGWAVLGGEALERTSDRLLAACRIHQPERALADGAI